MNGRHLFTFGASLLAGLLSLGLAHGPVMGQGQAEALSSSFRKATERVSLAVVSVRPIGPASLLPPGPLRPLDGLSRLPLRVGPGDQEPIGSGVVLDVGRGHVLTTDHVLQGVSQAVVVTADGRERVTSQIRREPGVDLAVLVVDLSGLNLAAATWGDPGTLQPGDWVLAVGRPGGAAPAISSGIFSARRRWSSAAGPGEDWLETDAAVNALNSGGPLINLAGQVVGINTPLTTRRGPIAGVGFALPADKVRRIAADLVEFGRVRRAFLGVQIEPAPSPIPSQPGSINIASVTPASPAAEGGLRIGDKIVSVGGRKVDGVAMTRELIESAAIGDELVLSIDRAGQRQDITVRPQARPVSRVGPGLIGAGAVPESRRDALLGRPRTKIGPGDPARTAAPVAGDETPNALEPVPQPAQPSSGRSSPAPGGPPPEGPR